MMEGSGNLIQDLRYAVVCWRGNHSFTVVTVLTLALGIGANTPLPVVTPRCLRITAIQNPERSSNLGDSPRMES